jgi:hypothetical protein
MMRLTITANIALALLASGVWAQDIKGGPEALVGTYGSRRINVALITASRIIIIEFSRCSVLMVAFFRI